MGNLAGVNTTVAMPVQDRNAEEALLGALMVTDGIGAVAGETRLVADAFYAERHRVIFRAMLKLADEDKHIDAITVVEELQRRGRLPDAGGRDYVSSLASTVPVAGNFLHYAEIVARKAEWRQRLEGAQRAVTAAQSENEDELAAATELLTAEIRRQDAVYDEERQREVLWSLLEGQARAEFVWPFDRLNRASAGGMRRGQVNIVAGYTGDGKSQFADQILDSNRKRGLRVALYDNEMTVEERVARRTTRLVGVPHSQLVAGELRDTDKRKIMRDISTMTNWPIIEIPGWSADEVAHHIRRNRWDLVVIDILHNFRFHEERELSHAVSTFKAAAGQARCCIVLVAHIKRISEGGKRRPPTRHDLRWSGDIENLAHTICFVYRRQDNEVSPPAVLVDGDVYFDKCRGGKLTSVPVRFNERRLRFDLRGYEDAP